MKNIKEYVAEVKEQVKQSVKTFTEESGRKLTLLIMQVGDNPASNAYIRGKKADCEEVGINCLHWHYAEDVKNTEVLLDVIKANDMKEIDGIIIQLPLPERFKDFNITSHISRAKDVDGFTINALVNPATPQGIIDYLEYNNFKFEDANAVVIGRSNIVGKPVARMLLEKNCNIRMLHSKTSKANKLSALKDANLVIVATGHRNTLVDEDLVETAEDCFIIDVGMNRNEDGKLCGDCENVTIREKTPVPGGVGLLTRLALITNMLKITSLVNV